MNTRCLPEAVLLEFLDDELNTAEETELEAHLRNCASCRARLDRLTAPVVGAPDCIPLPPALPAELFRRLEVSLSSLEDMSTSADLPEGLPDVPGYEMMELIGGGGSGAVYRAVHRGLSRTVAVKILHERTNVVHRQRLRREAEALATLRHPGIVQVFAIGEAGDRSFLALEFVSGGTLGEYIRGEPQLPGPAARLVTLIADALQHAHVAGFIHRDLKPGNILLEERYDAQESAGLDGFLPKISDFGVVKVLDEREHLTRTRDFVGTPCYMAPEQAYDSGHPIDARTDVYGLGAILYELLAGRPPFRSATPLDTLVQVRFDEPVPLRRLAPKVPRDLETICLKCLEKDPGRRYSSVLALGEDLKLFLGDRPVQARPVSLAMRGWRWCRRNSGWAAMLAVTVAVLLIAGVTGPLIAHRERGLRQEASAHEAAAVKEKARAREHLERASQALEETLGQVLLNARLQESGLEEVRTGILRTAAPYLEEFVHREEGDAVLQLRQGRALLQLAGLHVKNGQNERARIAYQRALDIMRALREEHPGLAGVDAGIAIAHMEYGRFLFVNARDVDASVTQFREALRIQEILFVSRPDDEKLIDELAITVSLLGSVLAEDVATQQEARALAARAVELRERLILAHPDRRYTLHYAALTHLNLALALATDSGIEALGHYERARELERQVIGGGHVSLEGPYTLSVIEGSYAIALGELHQFEKAWTHLASALEVADALVLSQPSVSRYLKNCRQWHDTALVLADREGDPAKTDVHVRRAVETYRRIKDLADGPDAAEAWLTARLHLVEFLVREKQIAEAVRESSAVADVLRPGLMNHPVLGLPLWTSVRLSLRLAGQLERLAHQAEALRWYDGIVTVVQGSGDSGRSTFLALAHHGRSRCYAGLGKLRESQAAAQAADQAEKQPADTPRDVGNEQPRRRR